MTASAERELDHLIARLHANERLRVWSIVITVFGDAVAPRGGVIWLGALQALMDRLDIGASALRAAMSRLAADGWVTRERLGRNSYYALAEAGRRDFDLATRRIYAAGPVRWDGRWTLCVVPEEAGEARDARRRALRDLGFGTLGPTVFLRPETEAAQDASAALVGATVFAAEARDAAGYAALADEAWPLAAAAEAYQAIVAAFSPLQAALDDGGRLEPLAAMAARTLLIHDFRRAALRDPLLPDSLRPEGWPGETARVLVARLYRQLLADSETWLDGCEGAPDGPLPNPENGFYERFGGVGEREVVA